MAKCDVLYCSTDEIIEGDIKKLQDYLRNSKWLVLREEYAAENTFLTHLAKASGNMVCYQGKDWVHLSVIDLAGTKTIDELLENNPFLDEENAGAFDRRVVDIPQ